MNFSLEDLSKKKWKTISEKSSNLPADDIISLLTVIVGQPACSGVRRETLILEAMP
ncbi:MAG: hypothetical protein ACM3PX_02435 [Omnitrophica WOR_2 bacterium]